MVTEFPRPTAAQCLERLMQAERVMQDLPDDRRASFDISIFAARRGGSIAGCIAGLCGLDPWFQAHGLTTTIADRLGGIGDISFDPGEFFGTTRPFFHSNYGPEFREKPVTYEAALASLRSEIIRLKTEIGACGETP